MTGWIWLRKIRMMSVLAVLLVAAFLLAACGGSTAGNGAPGDSDAVSGEAAPAGDNSGGAEKVFYIGGIPDQDVSVLNRRFGAVAEYLSRETGLQVEYVPSVDYAALVTAFERGDIHLAWFGGLTGVQARARVEGSEAIAQRPRDENFHSVFIVQKDLPVEELADLKGLTFTFGSESSTSGHLMPRYFLLEAGIDPEKDFRSVPNFSGSHDRTIKLVESGAYQAGVLNEAVWQSRLAEGKVDTDKVRAFYTTPPYYDYNWSIRGGVDEEFGPGTAAKVKEALLAMGPEEAEILELFQTDRFIETRNENYDAIRQVAERIGVIR